MGIAARIEGSVENWIILWGNRLQGWMISWVVKAVTGFIETIEPDAIDSIKDMLNSIADDPKSPEPVKNLIAKITAGGHPWPLFVIIPLAIVFLLPMIFQLSRPLGDLFMYSQNKLIQSFRLDPAMVITAWRRDQAKYAGLFDDLKEQGWSDERIEALKFATLHYPSPQDLVHWQAREVFEPDMIAKYGLTDELEKIGKEAFYKAGMDDEQIRNYWMAHWEHASWIQVVDMLRRGLLTEDDIWDWFRLVEIPPFWREKLIGISWEVPTRVDVRRFWDMRVIDEARLREIYQAQGYHGKDLDDYVLWTKVYVAFPDLLARFNNGWITEAQVKAELVKLGMAPARVDEMIQTKLKATKAARTQTERDLTRADIIKGVKSGVITRPEAGGLLEDLGYDSDESDFILEINIPLDDTDQAINQRELTKTDILNGLKEGVITQDEAKDRLMALRYSAVDSEFIIKIYLAAVSKPTEPRSKEQSKADVLMAVKKGLLLPADAYLMLQDIGFTPDASEFILTVNAETSPFSPVNYAEYLDLAGKYKRAIGESANPITDESKTLAAEVVKLTDYVNRLKAQIEIEKHKLSDASGLQPTDFPVIRELTVSLHRAETELDRVKSGYQRKIDVWRSQAK